MHFKSYPVMMMIMTNQNNQVYKSMRGLVAYLKAQAEAEKAARLASAMSSLSLPLRNFGYIVIMFVITALPNL